MCKGPEVAAILVLQGWQGCSCKKLKSEKEKSRARERAKENTAWRVTFEFHGCRYWDEQRS